MNRLIKITGRLVFFSVGLCILVMVFYPQFLEYFKLTEDKTPFHFWGKDGTLLAIAFFFVWGGAKFSKLSDLLLSKYIKSDEEK